jgi:hypothetical protein
MSTRLRPLDDLTPARWVEEGVGEFAFTVDGVLPRGFEAHARVLHPAESDGAAAPRWSEVAALSGRTVDSRTQWEDIAGPRDAEPSTGHIEQGTFAALCEAMAVHTSTPGQCYFALWNGWGWITGTGPLMQLPGREYLLYEAPVEAAGEVGRHGPGDAFTETPSLWWPADRAWCVATDVDLHSTYVGGSAALVRDLTGDPRLEALPAQRTDRLC